MALSPTDELLQRYQQHYGAGDKEEVLAGIQKYGTDDRSQWSPQPEVRAQQGVPQWDRTAFRDAWMGSGIQNVPDMQNWLRSTGWGAHVGLGGSKGDVMQLPSGENIDAVLAAGLGGNRGGPQWTGRGSWAGGYTPFNQMSQGQQQPQQNPYQMHSPGWYTGGNQGQWGHLMSGGGQQDPRFRTMMQNQGHQQFQRGMQQRQQPNYRMNMQRQGQGQAQKLYTPGRAAGQGIGPTQQPRQPMYY